MSAIAHFQQIFHAFSVQATLKGEEKTKPAARRQTHTQGRVLTVRHIFLPYAKYGKKKTKTKKHYVSYYHHCNVIVMACRNSFKLFWDHSVSILKLK